MSKALELANESESLAESRLEQSGYDWSVDADVQLRENAAELRRLDAALAIVDGELVECKEAYELVEEYADAVAKYLLESLYGTSKSYTLEVAKERDKADSALKSELRRLAAVEAELQSLKLAISEAAPIGYLYHDASAPENAHPWLHSTMIVMAAERRKELSGETPLYTLKGIK